MLRGFTIYRQGEEPERGEAEFNGSMSHFLFTAIRPIMGDIDIGFEEFIKPDGKKVRAFFPKRAKEQGLPVNTHEQVLRRAKAKGLRGTIVVLDDVE